MSEKFMLAFLHFYDLLVYLNRVKFISWIPAVVGSLLLCWLHWCELVSVAPVESVSIDDLKTSGRLPPKSLRPSAADAYLLFQVCLTYLLQCRYRLSFSLSAVRW